MNREDIPGLDSLFNLLSSFCYTRTNFNVYSDNVLDEFFGRRTEKGVLFCYPNISTPTVEGNEEIRKRFFDRIVSLPYIFVFIESLTNNIDSISCKQIIEYRGFEVEFKENGVYFRQLPREDVLLRSIDPQTGQNIEPDTNEIYY